MNEKPSVLPPHNLDAERYCIGAILRDNAQYDDAALLVNVDDFYGYPNKILFDVIGEMRERGEPIDYATVAARVHRAGKSEDVTPAYVLELHQDAPAATEAAFYADIIRKHAMARALIHMCDNITRDAFEPGIDVASLVEQAELEILRIAQGSLRREPRPTNVVMRESLTLLDQRTSMHRTGQATGAVPYGLKDLDDLTAGMHAGELVIVAGRPGRGKTILGCHIADHASSQGLPTLFVCLEQAAHELLCRLLSKHSRVNAFKIRKGSISNEDKNAIGEAASRLETRKIFWDDQPNQTVPQIASQARRLKARHGLEVVVVDYMQLLESSERKRMRHEEVGAMSRGLKLLARELNIPVVCMAQLNRAAEERNRPQLHDLRESGAIEQDADTVIALHRPNADRDEIELIVLKQRSGPDGTIVVMHDKDHYALVNAALPNPTPPNNPPHWGDR